MFLQQEDGWAMQLLAVTCLSLAAKMEETLVPSLLDLQAITPPAWFHCDIHFYSDTQLCYFIRVVMWIMDCTLADREHKIHLWVENNPSNGASRPHGAQLEAPIGHTFHIRRLLRLQSWPGRETHEIPDRPSHTNDFSCNTRYTTNACWLTTYSCCYTALIYAMPQTLSSWITARRQWLPRRCCAPPVRRRRSHRSTLGLQSIGALA